MTTKLLVFTSPSCAPCRQLKPNLQKLQEEHGFEATYYELSDDTRAVFSVHGVRQVPFVIGVDEAGGRKGAFFGAQAAPILEKHLRDWGVIE